MAVTDHGVRKCNDCYRTGQRAPTQQSRQLRRLDISLGVRTQRGLAASFIKSQQATYVRGPDNSERLVKDLGVYDTTEHGDVIGSHVMSDGNTVLALRRWSEPILRVLTPPGSFAVRDAAFAPGGQMVAYQYLEDILYCRLAEAAIEDCHTIAHESGRIHNASISPDGRNLVYFTTIPPDPRLRVVPLPGGERRVISAQRTTPAACHGHPIGWSGSTTRHRPCGSNGT